MKAKRVLITGASSGIGLQLAKDYRTDGWHTIACGRNVDRLQEAHPSEMLVFDIADREQALAAAREIEPTLDLIILNAGSCEYIDDPINFDSALMTRVINTNVIGMAVCLEAFLKYLKPGGHLALMGSSAVLLPFSRAQAYGASKAAVSYLAASLRVDLKQNDIAVSLIQPGFVETPLTEKNNFKMPGIISVSEASRSIRSGLYKRKSTVATPWFFNAILGLLGRLPHPIPSAIAAKLRQS